MNLIYNESINSFVYRCPVNSISKLDRFHKLIDFDSDWENCIITYFDNADANDGLMVASPSLHHELKNLKDGTFKSDKKKRSAILSLYRYILRSHSKCTPFGLFSGIGTGEIKNEENRLLPLSISKDLKIRLDTEFLSWWCEMISSDERIKIHLKFYVNHTAFISDGFLKYYDYEVLNNFRKYFLSKIELTEEIQYIMELCKSGVQLSTVILEVAKEFKLSMIEVGLFIDELILNKLLISELFPNVTGCPYLTRVINTLSKIDSDALYIRSLTEVERVLHDDSSINDKIKFIKNKAGYFNSNVLQCDLVSNSHESLLNSRFVLSIVDNLNKIAPFMIKHKDFSSIDVFKMKFLKKFGDQEIPLNIAIDKEKGVDFGQLTKNINSSLIDGITMPNKINDDGVDTIKLFEFDKMLLKKYSELNQYGYEKIVIDDADLVSFKRKEASVANSCFLFGSLIGKGTDEKFIFGFVDGPPSSRLFGRFCYANDHLTSFTKSLHDMEEQNEPDTVFVELLYVGQDRAGNILARPHLRSFEIPIMGTSTEESNSCIPLDDLLVSVRNGNVILKSKTLNKRVIPRESSAFNAGHNNIPAYIFLTYLQLQEARSMIVFQMPQVLKDLSYVPRIEYKNIILSLARWKITYTQVAEIIDMPISIDTVTMLKKKFLLPSNVRLSDGEGKLTLNLDNPLSVSILLDALKSKKDIILEEEPFLGSISDFEECQVFKNEIVIPILNSSKKQTLATLTDRKYLQKNNVYHPGSEYLYLKFYLSEDNGNPFLKDLVYPWMNFLVNEKLIEGFFFIRYWDESHHIRLRIVNKKKPINLFKSLDFLNDKIERFIDVNILDNYYIAPYEQENDTYGSSMQEAELLFYADSLFVLELIKYHHEMLKSEKFLVNVLIFGINQIFELFDTPEIRMKEIIKVISDNFLKEFGDTKQLRIRLDSKFRDIYKLIDLKNIGNDIDVLFEKRYRNMKSMREMYSSNRQEEDSRKIEHLIGRLIHLYVNRICSNNPRKHEVSLYHIMNKYYISRYKQGLSIL